ncbi:proteasome subunit beta [Candidatus Thorarchaeota archaeon]|jgi:proteasome beta subunit|nr:proteasome subunit beta [Candidatus Thorarchaeota archaeon]TFG97119.1 MAG: proteasome subunit beta [Candidatus Thorarchaeota archaeon]
MGRFANVLKLADVTKLYELPHGGSFTMSFPTGATVVGIKCTDGAVIATDTLITWGTHVLSEKGVKAFKLTDTIVLASAGLTSDYQMLVNRLRAQIKLYELNQKKSITVKALSKMIANTLYSTRMAPLYVQTVVVGMDGGGPQLYTLDMGGSLIPDEFTATGTGTGSAYGVLENYLKTEVTVKEAEEIAIKAVKAGMSRDIQSGGDIHVMSVTKGGVTERTVN